MSKNTLYFHIGPVQGFISQARRTRDYWAGSFLLSWLTAQAMAKITKAGGTIITPCGVACAGGEENQEKAIIQDSVYLAVKTIENGEILSAAPFLGTLGNHFSASMPSNFNAKEFCEEAVLKKWIDLSEAVWNAIFPDNFEWVDDSEKERVRQIWDSQIGRDEKSNSPFWEIFWVTTKENDRKDLLDARKYCRISSEGESDLAKPYTGNFCSMMHGWQEISGYVRQREKQQQDAFWSNIRKSLLFLRYKEKAKNFSPDDCLDLASNERLSAPALVKRVFPLLSEEKLMEIIGWFPRDTGLSAKWTKEYRGSILEFFKKHKERIDFSTVEKMCSEKNLANWPSTSYMSAAHWIAKAQRLEPDLTEKFATELAQYSIKHAIAEQYLWLNCIKQEDKKHNPIASVDGAMCYMPSLEKEDKNKRGAPLKTLKQLQDKIGNPSPYFAILRMDGDHMGQLLSEEKLKEGISSGLNKFNLLIRGNPDSKNDDEQVGVVALHNGVIMFAGGDDLLAMFPIEDVVPAAIAIHKTFLECFSDLKKETLPLDISISAAVTIADRKAPLRWVLEENTRLLDNVAKEVSDRNSFAVNLLLPGTEGFQWAIPWEIKTDNEPIFKPVEVLSNVIEKTAFEYKHLSGNNFFYKLRTHMKHYIEEDDRCSHSERIEDQKNSLSSEYIESATNLLHFLSSTTDSVSSEDHVSLPIDFSKDLFNLCCVYKKRKNVFFKTDAPLTIAPLKIARLIARNWHKKLDCYDYEANERTVE